RHEVVVGTADRVGGVVRDAVVPPQTALQRQPPSSPLILPIEIDRDDVATRTKPARIGEVLRDLIWDAVVGPDLDDGAVVVVVLRRRAEPALVAKLHVVRAADIRKGCPPLVRPDVALAEPAIRKSGMSGDQAGDRAATTWNVS